MGRLQIEVRHGGNGPAQWGAVVALIVLVVYAAAGHHKIATMLHEILSVVEIAACAAVGLGVLALALIITIRVRRAKRRQRIAHRAAVPAAAYSCTLAAETARRAIDAPRMTVWPVPGERDEISRRDSYRRNS